MKDRSFFILLSLIAREIHEKMRCFMCLALFLWRVFRLPMYLITMRVDPDIGPEPLFESGKFFTWCELARLKVECGRKKIFHPDVRTRQYILNAD